MAVGRSALAQAMAASSTSRPSGTPWLASPIWAGARPAEMRSPVSVYSLASPGNGTQCHGKAKQSHGEAVPGSTTTDPRPAAEAVGLLGELGDDAWILAGGQSLVPMLALRLATFEHLVDISRIEELRGIEPQNGSVRMARRPPRHRSRPAPRSRLRRPCWPERRH